MTISNAGFPLLLKDAKTICNAVQENSEKRKFAVR